MKTSELTGALLDYWVARSNGTDAADLWIDRGNGRNLADCVFFKSGVPFRPSTSWAHGGPIIERERIQLEFHDWHREEPWCAQKHQRGGDYERGPTPLVAAMRAYVASKFGDEVPADPVGAHERKKP